MLLLTTIIITCVNKKCYNEYNNSVWYSRGSRGGDRQYSSGSMLLPFYSFIFLSRKSINVLNESLRRARKRKYYYISFFLFFFVFNEPISFILREKEERVGDLLSSAQLSSLTSFCSLLFSWFLRITLLLLLLLLLLLRGVIVKAMYRGIVVSEFKFQSRYYVHFWTNTLAKGINPLILPAMG